MAYYKKKNLSFFAKTQNQSIQESGIKLYGSKLYSVKYFHIYAYQVL